MKKFCYKCGALEDDVGQLIDGLCPKCYLEKSPLLEIPPKIKVVLCKSCGAVKSGGRWVKGEVGMRHEILKHVKVRTLSEYFQKPRLSVQIDVQREEADISATVKYNHRVIEEKKSVKLDLDYRICETCSLKHSNYYEVVVQVRGHLDFDFERLIRKLAVSKEMKAPRDFLVRITPVKNGIDAYVSSVKLGKKILSTLKRMGARIHESRKLVGQTRDGKKRYKFSYAAHFKG